MTAELIIPLIVVIALIAAVVGGLVTVSRTRPKDRRFTGEAPQSDRPRLRGIAPRPVLMEQPEPGAQSPETASQEKDIHTTTPVAVVEKQRIIEEPPEATGVTRRRFFNRALGLGFFGFLAVLGMDALAFFWPRLSGGFGSDINAGSISDLQSQMLNADGSITPVFVPEARAYVVPAPQPIPETYQGKGVAIEGLFALHQRCVHLGCRVPWCSTSQGFECPCHGSKYSMIGEYFAGPAPRSLDRFVVEITSRDELVIKTGQIIQTPRLGLLNVPYPQGPSCIGG